MRHLTEIAIRTLPHPPQGSTKHMDPSLPGFGVRCTARSKSFFVMFGKERRLKTLGRWPQISLKEARQEAKAILVAPPPKKRATGLLAARTAFLDDCQARLRPSTVERYRYALANLPNVTLDEVPTAVSDPNQLKALKALFYWCIEQQLTDRNPFIRRKVVFNTRDRLLTDEEIAALLSYDHPPYSSIVQLLIRTGQRRSQFWRYQPTWKDGDAITFPANVMKSKAAHLIPVTRYGSLLPNKPFSFHSWSKSKKRMDKATGVKGYVLHDFRRYLSSTMAKLGVPLHVTEHLIDHRTQVTGVAAIYNLYQFVPEMRDALLSYEDHLRKLAPL